MINNDHVCKLPHDADNCKEGIFPIHVLYTFMKIKYFFHIVVRMCLKHACVIPKAQGL